MGIFDGLWWHVRQLTGDGNQLQLISANNSNVLGWCVHVRSNNFNINIKNIIIINNNNNINIILLLSLIINNNINILLLLSSLIINTIIIDIIARLNTNDNTKPRTRILMRTRTYAHMHTLEKIGDLLTRRTATHGSVYFFW